MVQSTEMLLSNLYTRYIKDPYNKDTTMTYLNKTLAHSKKATSKEYPLLPPYGISFKSLTLDVGPLEKGVHFTDDRHYNACLLVPRLVYHLCTKLKDDVIYKHLGLNLSVSSQAMGNLPDLTLLSSLTTARAMLRHLVL